MMEYSFQRRGNRYLREADSAVESEIKKGKGSKAEPKEIHLIALLIKPALEHKICPDEGTRARQANHS
jgi:hypothetical protein